jgi:hypothetical protein
MAARWIIETADGTEIDAASGATCTLASRRDRTIEVGALVRLSTRGG